MSKTGTTKDDSALADSSWRLQEGIPKMDRFGLSTAVVDLATVPSQTPSFAPPKRKLRFSERGGPWQSGDLQSLGPQQVDAPRAFKCNRTFLKSGLQGLYSGPSSCASCFDLS